jgi:hypothetical protein
MTRADSVKTAMQRTGRAFGSVVHDMVFELLRRKDKVLNALAVEAVAAIGKGFVPLLVAEAVTSQQVDYQLRLLHAIEAIGDAPGTEEYCALVALSEHRNPRIQEAVARIILAVGPHGARRRAELQATKVQ